MSPLTSNRRAALEDTDGIGSCVATSCDGSVAAVTPHLVERLLDRLPQRRAEHVALWLLWSVVATRLAVPAAAIAIAFASY
jgi:hypothetical protein